MSNSVEVSTPQRWRVLGTGAALLIAGRLVAAACGLVQVPIALAHLGPERFGVWIALSGLLWSLASFDGGIGFALQNRIACCLARGNAAAAAGLARLGQRWLWTAAAIMALAGAVLILGGNWNRWLGIADTATPVEINTAVAVAFIAAALAIPLSLSTRVAAAAQQTWITGLWTAVGSIGGLLAVIGAALVKASLLGFTMAACVLLLLPPLGTWFHLRHRGAWPKANGTIAAPPDTNALRRQSAAFFVPQIGAAFLGAFVPTLVAFVAGPAAAAAYGVLQRLFGIVLQLQILALQPTWPAYTHAAAQNDHDAALRIFRASMIGTGVTVLGMLLLFVPLTPAVLRLWLGATAPAIGPALLWTVALWHLVQCIGQPAAMLLNGMGRAHVVAVSGSVSIVISLGLCAWWGGEWGAIGVVAALAVPYIGLNLPIIAWQARRTLAAFQPHKATL